MSERTDTSRGDVLGLVAWVSAVSMLLSVAVKIVTKIAVTHSARLSIDGALILGAMILAGGQTGALSIAIQDGLGDNISALAPSKIQDYQRAIYSTDILFILSLCLTKLSIVVFFLQSTIGNPPRISCGVLGCFVSMWAITSVFGLAFQCNLPSPWMFIQNTCFNQKTFWYYIGIVDVVTDVLIIALPFYTLQFLQISAETRLKLVAPFCTRVLVLPIAILRMIFLANSINSTDPTYDSFRAILMATLEMNLAIIVSCIPLSRVLITNVQSGLLTTNLRTHAPNFDGTAGLSLGDITGKSQKDNSNSQGSSGLRSETGNGSVNGSGKNLKMPWRDTKTTTSISSKNYGNAVTGSRSARKGSPTESEQHIIRTTTEWAIEHAAATEEQNERV